MITVVALPRLSLCYWSSLMYSSHNRCFTCHQWQAYIACKTCQHNFLGSEEWKKCRKTWSNKQIEGSEYFFETSEDLEDSPELKFHGSRQPSDTASKFFNAESSLANDKLHGEIPSFSQIPGLLPNLEERERSHVLEQTGYLDSFVKVHVILLD